MSDETEKVLADEAGHITSQRHDAVRKIARILDKLPTDECRVSVLRALVILSTGHDLNAL
jgi:hypothetical protein